MGTSEALDVYLDKSEFKNLNSIITNSHLKIAKKQKTWLRKDFGLKATTFENFKNDWNNFLNNFFDF